MEKYLSAIKIGFIGIVFGIFFVVGGGGLFARSNPYLNVPYATMTAKYFAYKAELAKDRPSSLLASISWLTSSAEEQSSSQAHAQSVPVLVYHGIMEEADEFNVSTAQFKEQMTALHRAGYRTVSLEDFYEFLQGKKQLPARSFLLTFDDGRRDSYYNGDPILRALGFQATMFVITEHSTTGNADTGYYISGKDTKFMAETGRWNIQAHTAAGHDAQTIDAQGATGIFYADKLWRPSDGRLETEVEYTARVRADLERARNDIENLTKKAPIGFAFPFGEYGQNSKNFPQAASIMRRETGSLYKLAFYQNWDGDYSNNYPELGRDFYMVRRTTVSPKWNGEQLAGILLKSEEKPLPYSDSFTFDAGWSPLWGTADVRDESLHVRAAAATNGASVTLSGTSGWRDYAAVTRLQEFTGGTFSMLARYQSDEHYAGCIFSNDGVRVEQRTRETANEQGPMVSAPDTLAPGNVLGIQVAGNQLTCLVNGAPRAQAELRTVLTENGGIAFKTWGEETGAIRARIDDLSVTEAF